jgi:hypothetical protein
MAMAMALSYSGALRAVPPCSFHVLEIISSLSFAS